MLHARARPSRTGNAKAPEGKIAVTDQSSLVQPRSKGRVRSSFPKMADFRGILFPVQAVQAVQGIIGSKEGE